MKCLCTVVTCQSCVNYNDGNIDFYPGSLGGGERYWIESGLTQQAASGSWVACD